MRSKMLACGVTFVTLLVRISSAQYVEQWHYNAGSNDASTVGCANTDADNAKEVVVVWSAGMNDYRLSVIDGQSGVVEWSSEPWVSIRIANEPYPQLIDPDNDGRYDILFWGEKTGYDTLGWHLYGFNGVGMQEKWSPAGSVQHDELGQSYPNPAGALVSIEYSIVRKGSAVVRMYNSAGQVVRTLNEGERVPGKYTLIWDGRDAEGTKLPGGSYFYELEVNGERQTKKMVLTK